MRLTVMLFMTLLMIASTSCKKDDPIEEVEEYAYPPEDMLRFFDFPVGSTWHYKCLQDGTIDTLIVFDALTSKLRQDRFANGSFKVRSVHHNYYNVNGMFEVESYAKEGVPSGEVIDGQEKDHKLFTILTASLSNAFNYQAPLSYPFHEVNAMAGDSVLFYEKLDTTIQGMNYPEVYRFPRAWVGSTFSNPIVEEWYVQDIGVVRYTLQNGMEYELVDYHINQ